MKAWGWIGFVEPVSRGSETLAAATAGDSTLDVVDVSDFLGSAGIADLGHAGAPISYTDASIHPDGLGGTLTLAADLAADAPAGTLVQLWVDGGPVVEYQASVTLTTGGQVRALVRDSKVLHLPDGPRTAAAQELVSLTWSDDDGTWVVESIEQQTPRPDLSSARPQSLPAGAIGPGQINVPIVLGPGGSIQLTSGATLNDASGMPIVDGDDNGSLPSGFTTLGSGLATLAATVAALASGLPGPPSGIDGGIL